jgi:hypothetical protein
MKQRDVYGAASLVACLALLAAAPARAQAPAPQESVEVIVSPRAGQSHTGVRNFFQAFKQRLVGGYILPMTRCEKWSVPKSQVEAVKKEAAKRGVVVTELGGARFEHMMQSAPDDTKLNAKQRAMLERVKAAKATQGVKLMVGPPPAVLEHTLTKDPDDPTAGKITVAVDANTTKTIVRTSIDLKPHVCIWRGTMQETGAQVTLMWWPDGSMAGTVQEQNRVYSIRHVGGPLYAMVDMSGDRMPSDHAPMPTRLRSADPNLRDDPLVNHGDASMLRTLTAGMRVPKPSTGKKGEAQPIASPPPAPDRQDIIIDVAIAYTRKAAAHYTDIKRELIDLAIEEGNESFRNSGVGNVKLRLVHAYQTDYVEEGAHFDHVWRFADKGDGYMEEIHGLRNKHKADVAVLLVDDPAGCGLATRVYADPDEAFAVVHHECAAASYTVAHEIGHLIGARHDLSMDKVMSPFPYGHGYVNGTKWRDIMSYKDSCAGCPRIPVWSSPLIKVKGEPAGTPDQDNARVIAEQAARVAAFR